MTLSPISSVLEGQSVDICVIMESQNSEEIGFDVIVIIEITDGSASEY